MGKLIYLIAQLGLFFQTGGWMGLRYNQLVFLMDQVELKAQNYSTSQGNNHKYQHISLEKRKRLIEMVFVEGRSIYRSCRDLAIKNSTAKAIVHRYKLKGTMYIKKNDKEPSPQNSAVQNTDDYKMGERIGLAQSSLFNVEGRSEAVLNFKVERADVFSLQDCMFGDRPLMWIPYFLYAYQF